MSPKRIHFSHCTNPWVNLAIDHILMLHPQQPDPQLFLWQNQRTVVVGRNQNAWKECRTALLEQEDGRLARRPSGGGAVFHDLGNLCFTFLCQQSDYDVDVHWEIIRRALALLGIQCQTSGRNDLTVDGRKFSGSAFMFRNGRALHHGTLMMDVDVTQMTRYLSVSKEKIAAKGVDSVRSRVINLNDIVPMTMDQLRSAMVTAFADYYHISDTQPHIWDEAQLMAHPQGRQTYEEYASWQWRYGASPQGDIELDTRFAWGGVQLLLTAREGHVTAAQVYSDALDLEFIDRLTACLPGTALSPAALAQAVCNLQPAPLASDVSTWLAACDL